MPIKVSNGNSHSIVEIKSCKFPDIINIKILVFKEFLFF